jgi:hypothetical protein
MKKTIFIIFGLLSILSFCSASQKIYIDENELNIVEDAFYMHQGDNVWFKTHTLHRDMSGLFTYENSIVRTSQLEYQRQWKCPYCNRYYAEGKPCTYDKCPSKNKMTKI